MTASTSVDNSDKWLASTVTFLANAKFLGDIGDL